MAIMAIQKGFPKQAVDRLKKVPAEKYPYRDLYLSIALRECGKTKAADESYRAFLKRHAVPYAASYFEIASVGE